eukprot:scaffold136693_cov22-Tisochrysis_lutea.AAC.3
MGTAEPNASASDIAPGESYTLERPGESSAPDSPALEERIETADERSDEVRPTARRAHAAAPEEALPRSGAGVTAPAAAEGRGELKPAELRGLSGPSESSPEATSSRHEESVANQASRTSVQRNSRSSVRRGVMIERKQPSGVRPALAALCATSVTRPGSTERISVISSALSAFSSAEAPHSSWRSETSQRTWRGCGLPRRPCLRQSTPVRSISRRWRSSSARASPCARASAARCASRAADHDAWVRAARAECSFAAALAACASS